MTGDQQDMHARLLAALPNGWFADDAPVLSGLLNGLASAWAWLYTLLAYVRQQSRIATATNGWLDLIARDYGGTAWGRLTGETDAAFSARIRRNLQATSGTRAALIEVVTNFTGRTPVVFEPAYPPDTGGLGTTGLGWNTTGGWGNLNLPFQCFVTAYRPAGGGIANSGSWGSLAATTTQNLSLGGWNNGALQYGDATLIEGQITDAQIFATIANCLPTATIAWTRLSN